MARPENKDFILEKTFFLLLVKGYNGVSISDIQKKTGMSRGIIYHYYNSKEELFRAAAEAYLVTPFYVGIEATKGFTVADMIRHVSAQYTNVSKKWSAYNGAEKITMANYDFLFYQMISREATIAKTYHRMRREEKQAWENAVKLSLERNEIRAVLNTNKIAIHFTLLIDGIWMESAENGSVSSAVKLIRKVLNDYYELIKV